MASTTVSIMEITGNSREIDNPFKKRGFIYMLYEMGERHASEYCKGLG